MMNNQNHSQVLLFLSAFCCASIMVSSCCSSLNRQYMYEEQGSNDSPATSSNEKNMPHIFVNGQDGPFTEEYRGELSKALEHALCCMQIKNAIIENQVADALVLGADVNQPDPQGVLPIIHAIDCGNIALIGTLIQNGADINRIVSYGEMSDIVLSRLSASVALLDSPLTSDNPGKMKKKVESMRQLLISQNSKLKESSLHLMSTPLIYAIQKNKIEMVDALIALGADVNQPDFLGILPIIHAIDYKDLASIKKLIQAGARTNLSIVTPQQDKSTELSQPRWTHKSTINLKLHSLVKREYLGYNTFTYVTKKGFMDGMKYLFEQKKEDVNQEDGNKNFPLLCSVKFNHIDAFAFLLDQGAEINQTGMGQQTVFTYICGGMKLPRNAVSLTGKRQAWPEFLTPYAEDTKDTYNHEPFFNLLTKHPFFNLLTKHPFFNPSLSIHHKCTNRKYDPLFFSAFHNHFFLCKWLIHQGAKIDMGENESNPLKCFCNYKNWDGIWLLLGQCAKELVSRQDQEGVASLLTTLAKEGGLYWDDSSKQDQLQQLVLDTLKERKAKYSFQNFYQVLSEALQAHPELLHKLNEENG